MEQTAIAVFPFETDLANNCLARTTNVNDTIVSALKAWILTPKGSRLGNMVGCFLPDILHDLVGFNDLAPLSRRLQADASLQFPGVNFVDVNMSLDMSQRFVDLVITISFSTSVTDIHELQLLLPTGMPTHNQ
jgi:hypothetical protein